MNIISNPLRSARDSSTTGRNIQARFLAYPGHDRKSTFTRILISKGLAYLQGVIFGTPPGGDAGCGDFPNVRANSLTTLQFLHFWSR